MAKLDPWIKKRRVIPAFEEPDIPLLKRFYGDCETFHKLVHGPKDPIETAVPAVQDHMGLSP